MFLGFLRRFLLLLDWSFVAGTVVFIATIALAVYDEASIDPSTLYQLTQEDIEEFDNLQKLGAEVGDFVNLDANKLVRKEEVPALDITRIESFSSKTLDFLVVNFGVLVGYLILRWLLTGSVIPFCKRRI